VADDLTKNVVVWAAETAGCAAQLASKQARDAYLAARRRELIEGAVAEGATPEDAELLADTCVNAAHRIMTELLAQRAGGPKGRA
jgi:cellobiose-specific phosphotransferase system component IIA